MNRRFTRFLLALVVTLGCYESSFGQTVQVSMGNDTTLPCGITCLNLTANLTKVTGTSSYTIDSSLLYSGHYSFTQGSATGIPIIDDKFSSLITIPFSFCFYGVSYTQCVISTNGHISFDASKANATSFWTVSPQIPTSQNSGYGTYYDPPSIMPAFHDLYNPSGGTITYFTTGTAPNRKFVVNWNQVPHYSCTSVTSTFQAVLYEGTNVIEFYIQDKPFCTASTSSGKAVSGIFGSAASALAAPGKNATQWGTSGMNKAYRFTPTGTSTPTVQLLSATGSIITSATPVASTNPALLTATFNNICLSADSAFYIARVIYPCNNTIVYDTIKVKKQVTPVPAVTSPVSFCQSATATPLSATGQSILWYSAATGGTGSTTAPTPNTTAAGTQVYYVSQTINGCESPRDSIVVNVIANPPPTPSGNSPVCEGDTVKLFSATIPGTTYAWTGPNSFSSSSQNPAIPNASLAAAGTYTVTTGISGCSTSGTVNIVINPRPVISSTSFTNPTGCGGSDGTITLNGLANGTTYTVSYSKNGIAQSPLSLTAASGSATITGLTTGNYIVSVTASGCTSLPTATIQLTDPTPPAAPTVSNNGPICEGNTLNLTASTISGATYSWTGPNNFSSALQNPTIANAQPVNGGVYTLAITVANCTSTPVTTTAVINPVPVITNITGTNPTTCLGTNGSIAISGLSPNTSYTINFSKNGIPQTAQVLTSNGSGVLTLSNLDAGTYGTITPMTAAGCTSASAGPVTLTDPLPPAAPTAGNNGPICEGSTLNLTATTVNGAIYTWTGPNSFSSSNQNPAIISATTLASGVYSVTATVNNCTSTAGTTTVVVNAIPATPTAGSNSPICEGSNLNLTANAITGASYNWTGPIGFTASTQNPTLTAATTSASGTYTVTATVNGCTSASGTTTVTVNPVPVIGTVSFTNPTTCSSSDGSITLTGVIPNTNYSVSYTKNGTPQAATSITSGSTGTLTITGLGAGLYTNITITLNGCSSAPAGPITLTSPAAPAATTASNNGPLCAGATLNLSAAAASGIYSWTGPNGFTSSQQNPSITNVTTANAGTYSVTVTANGCTSVAAATTVVVNPVPATPTAGSNSPVCTGNTINLTSTTVTGATYSWTGPNAFTSTSQNPIITNAQSANAGSYAVTATVNGCTSTAGTVSVVVNSTPVITSVTFTDPTTCNGTNGTIIINGLSNSTSYTVNYAKNTLAQTPAILTSNATGSITISGLGAGTYSNIQVTLNGCTSNSAGPVTLTNPSGPTQPTVSNNGPLCSGATLNLTSSTVTGATYSWSGPGGFNSTLQNPSITNVQTTNAGTYSLSVTLNGCTSLASTTNVVVNQTPATPTITSNSPVCAGNNLTLNASSSAGATYGWTGPNSFTANAQNAAINNATTAASGTYTVTASLNGCNSQAATINAVVNPVPPAPVVSNVLYCQFANATPLTATGQNLRWYTQATGGAGNTTAPTPSTTGVNSTTWYVSQVVNGCESPRSAITATIVSQAPTPAVVSPVNYCEGAQATSLSATGQNLLWYSQATGGTGSPVAPTPSTAASGTTTWYVTQTVNNCESQRAAITVTVYPIPAAPAVTTPVLYCAGDDAFALTAQGQNLLWYAQPAGGTGSTASPVPTTTAAGSTDYYVSQSVNGCESGRATVTVTVSEKVFAKISLNNSNICQYDTIIVSNDTTNPGTATYSWNFDGGEVISGSGSGPYLVRWITEGTKTITVTVANGPCSATESREITLKPSPFADFELQSDACIGEVMNVQASWNALAGSTYHWDFGNAKVLSGTGAGYYRIMWDVPGDQVVNLKISNINGCWSNAAADTISIHDIPDPKITTSVTNNICVGDTLALSVTGLNDTGSYSYQWRPTEFFITNGVKDAQAIIKKTGLISLIVADEHGCTGRDSVMITSKLCCDIILPDAFTPNGDGRNDLFRAVTQVRQQVSSFRIMNRWGQTVFETANGGEGWDGTLGGEPQDSGTFYYFIKYTCGNNESFEKKGEVTLIR